MAEMKECIRIATVEAHLPRSGVFNALYDQCYKVGRDKGARLVCEISAKAEGRQGWVSALYAKP